MTTPRRPTSADLSDLGTDWVAYSPVVTSQTGSTMVISPAATGFYKQIGYKHWRVLCTIPILTVGDSSGSLRATFPFVCDAKNFVGVYFESVAGDVGFCFVVPGLSVAFFSMRNKGFLTPIVAGNTINADISFSTP